MKIAQIIPGIGIHSGGPSRSVVSLTQGLRGFQINAEVITNDDPTDALITSESWVRAIPYRRNRLGYNHRFYSFLKECDHDLFHIHSIFSYSTTIAMRVARKRDIPFIVSPRGSLLKSALSISSKLLKSVFNRLILFPDLNTASAIHATSVEEMNDCFALGIKRPIILIPNSISIPKDVSLQESSVFRVAVCGRINPIKNLDGILRAWKLAGMDKKEAELVIIGGARLSKEIEYLEELHRLEKELKIPNVLWTGPKYGTDLQDILSTMTLLLLASHSENFGMVIPEAMALGLPVIASHGTPWSILADKESGWWIDNSDDSISNTLTKVFDMFINNKADLICMGRNGQRLAQKEYSQETIARKWIEVYQWILEGKEKPAFVSDPDEIKI